MEKVLLCSMETVERLGGHWIYSTIESTQGFNVNILGS